VSRLQHALSPTAGEQGGRGAGGRKRSPALLLAAILILLLATGLRFHRLDAQSFWNDEGNSARLSERPIAAILEGTASDIHPPLYYLLLHGWRALLGDSEFALRALSTFAGVVTVAAVAALAKRRSQYSAGRYSVGQSEKRSDLLNTEYWLPATLLAAVSPVLVYYSQETRMYALLALLAALSTWTLLVWRGGAGRRWAVAYVLLAAAGLYTHYFFPAVMAAQGAVVLIGRATSDERQVTSEERSLHSSLVTRHLSLVRWFLLAAAAVALYLPWLPIFLRQVGGREGERPPLLSFLADGWRWLVLGPTIGPREATWALVAAVLLVLLGLFFALRHPSASESADSTLTARHWPPTTRDRSLIPLIPNPWPLVVVPLALMYLVGATDPAFFKFLLAAVPFLCLLMGLGWAAPRRWLWLPALLTALVLAGSAASLGNLYGDPAFARADYRAIAARIAADDRNTAVLLVAPNQWEVFTYYHRDGAPVYPLPLGQPDPALLEPELARIAAAHERLYVLYWGEAQRDPERIIERWLDANTFKASEEWVGDVRFAVYAVAPATATRPTPSGADFTALDGEVITLQEYAVWPMVARPGEVVGVRLVWSADVTPARPYKVFLHLLAADGRLVAQRDGEPGGGSRPTMGWAAGELVGDNHGLLLPADLPAGEYALRLGLYDAFDAATRLPVAGDDSLLLGLITVQP
jgi:mannosyltransferase